MRNFAKGIVPLFVFAAQIFAQVDTGTIVGTVADPSGALVPGATVTVTEVNTNIATTVVSGQDGTYVATPLKVGSYRVGVEAQGFKSQTRENIGLRVQDRLRVDFSLAVGNISENVVITGEPPMLQTETSSLGEVVDARQVTELPLNGRDFSDLATLTTGVIDTKAGTNGNTNNMFVANGTRSTLNNFLVDGIDNNELIGGYFTLHTSVDAIQEFKIQTSSFSAEFGRSGGAVMNVTIKSGTNQFHGTAYEYLRNDALDARDFYEDSSQPKVPLRRNEFGGTLGGPIIRNRTFFFGDYQGTRLTQGANTFSSVPTVAQRNGDFSGAGNQTIFDPQTGGAGALRQPFAGNIIPTSRIIALGQNYMNLYPDPNLGDKLRNNYRSAPATTNSIDQGDIRVDHNISAKSQLFTRFSISDSTRVRPGPLPGLANGGGYGTGNTTHTTRGAVVGYTQTFSPTIVNEFRTGFTRGRGLTGIPIGGAKTPPESLIVPGVAQGGLTAGPTTFNPNGYRFVGEVPFDPTTTFDEELQLSDTLSLIRGRHTLKLGFQARQSRFNIFQVANPRGAFTFSGQFTRDDPNNSATGASLADMLLGLPIRSDISTLGGMRMRQPVYGGFIQDDFKVSQSLTLNLGLRYDYFGPVVEADNRQASFDFSTGKLIYAGKNGVPRGLVDVDKKDFAPRVGFAYSPFKDHKTVVRGAFGLFFTGQEAKTADPLQPFYNVPFFFEPRYLSDGITPVLTVAGGFPPLNPANAQFPGVTSLDRRLRTPYFEEWNFTVEREFPSRFVLDVGYVGSHGAFLQVVTDQNQVRVPGPGDIQSRRPYPTFGNFTAIQNRGNSRFHSLQIKSTKRTTHGLSFLSSFTFSKAMNDQPEICCSFPDPQNSYDLRAEKGRADFDQKFRWVTSFEYELPFGKGKPYLNNSRLLDLVLGGWSVDGIMTLTSGFPFSALLSFDTSNTGGGGQAPFYRPDRIASGKVPHQTPDLWFDINAFPTPAPYTFGGSGRNILDGPGFNNWDTAIHKEFALTERHRFQLRADFFNMFNHPHFDMPDNFVDDGPGAAGVITGLSTPQREIQLAVRYKF